MGKGPADMLRTCVLFSAFCSLSAQDGFSLPRCTATMPAVWAMLLVADVQGVGVFEITAMSYVNSTFLKVQIAFALKFSVTSTILQSGSRFFPF